MTIALPLKKSFICTGVATCILFAQAPSFCQNKPALPAWAFGPFVRPQNANPVLSPEATATFLDPMSSKAVHWEANDVFNPAATVKDNQICILYRAEDKSGVAIGTRTSRIGLARSDNG